MQQETPNSAIIVPPIDAATTAAKETSVKKDSDD